MMKIAIGAGLVWLLIFSACAVLTRIPPRGRAGAGRGLATAPPALINLVVAGGRLDGAAYAATILDLASRGELVITESAPGQLRCGLPRAGPPAGGLASFEELVLGEARRQAGRGPLPFEVLAEGVAADVPGLWASFEKAVREAGRQRGLTRPRLSGLVLTGLVAGAIGVALLIFLAELGRRTAGLAAPVFAGTVVGVVFTSLVGSLTGQDRLTRAGADLAAQATAAPAGGAAWPRSVWSPGTGTAPPVLRQLAVAVAAHAAVPLPGTEPGRRSGVRVGGRRSASQPSRRPRAAWSSMSGEWRLVPIRRPGIPLLSNPFPALSLAAAATLAVLIIGALVREPGASPGIVLAVPLAAAVGLAAVGLVLLTRYLAQPATAMFTAQVIARWEEDLDSDDGPGHVYRYAVDDGQQTWCGEASQADFARIRVGELVQVSAAPRSRTLTGLDFIRAAPGWPR
ncbi:MAG TPA: hypothetical protein VGH77_01945 [Streptosporangiaceae bacterium]|jgi:hypothetical protein